MAPCHMLTIIEEDINIKSQQHDMLRNGTFFIHYNKICLCAPSDFTRFWVNSLVLVNWD
jgi:hypothetical protein